MPRRGIPNLGILGKLPLEQILEIGVVTVLFGFLLFNSSVFEEVYPRQTVELYEFPWWRMLIVLLVVAGASWSPLVGLATASVAFFYLQDMHLLTTSFNKPIGRSF